jgi:hypothetical protein
VAKLTKLQPCRAASTIPAINEEQFKLPVNYVNKKARL